MWKGLRHEEEWSNIYFRIIRVFNLREDTMIFVYFIFEKRLFRYLQIFNLFKLFWIETSFKQLPSSCNLFVVNRVIKKISYVQDDGWQNTHRLCVLFIFEVKKNFATDITMIEQFLIFVEKTLLYLLYFFELASHIYSFDLSYIWYINGRRNKFIEPRK